jgi:beta-galactosidase
VPDLPAGLEVVVRTHHNGGRILFLLNHSTADVSVPLSGVDLLTGQQHESARVAAGGVVVLHEAV